MVYCVEMILEEFRSVPLGGYLAAAVWIGSMIMQSILINQKKIYTGGQKKIDAAVAAGNVARARLERVERKNRGSESSSYRYRGVYTYTVNGVEYHKSLTKNTRSFVDPLKLYYVSNPANAKTAGEMRGWSEQILPRIVPLALAVLTYWLFS